MAVVAPSGQKLPRGQIVQLVEPTRSWKLPDSHSVQDATPGTALYVPGAHGCGMTAPTEHSEPAGHTWQLDLSTRPVAFDQVPASHGCTTDEPLGHHAPGGQTVGSTVAAVGQTQPSGHDPAQAADFW